MEQTYLLQDLPCLCAVFHDEWFLIAPTFQPTLQDLAKRRIVLGDEKLDRMQVQASPNPRDGNSAVLIMGLHQEMQGRLAFRAGFWGNAYRVE